jgi:hypothetical protein
LVSPPAEERRKTPLPYSRLLAWERRRERHHLVRRLAILANAGNPVTLLDMRKGRARPWQKPLKYHLVIVRGRCWASALCNPHYVIFSAIWAS